MFETGPYCFRAVASARRTTDLHIFAGHGLTAALAHAVAHAFGAGDGGRPQSLQAPPNRKRRLLTHAKHAVAKRQTLAPDMIDHRMIGGRAGIRAPDAGVFDKLFGERDAQYHAG